MLKLGLPNWLVAWRASVDRELDRQIEELASGLSVADRVRIIEGEEAVVPVTLWRSAQIHGLTHIRERLFRPRTTARSLRKDRRNFLRFMNAP